MADFAIALDSPVSLKDKLVRVYMENNGEYRQISRKVPINFEVATYVTNNFATLWAGGSPLAESEWIAAAEAEFDTLYREVTRAAIKAARDTNNDLTDVVAAMEAVVDASDKSGAYNRLKTLAGNATAAQRDAFFLMCAFITLGKTASG